MIKWDKGMLECMEKDFGGPVPITEQTRQANLRRAVRGSVRMGHGMYRTDEEYQEYREKSLARPLP